MVALFALDQQLPVILMLHLAFLLSLTYYDAKTYQKCIPFIWKWEQETRRGRDAKRFKFKPEK